MRLESGHFAFEVPDRWKVTTEGPRLLVAGPSDELFIIPAQAIDAPAGAEALVARYEAFRTSLEVVTAPASPRS